MGLVDGFDWIGWDGRMDGWMGWDGMGWDGIDRWIDGADRH